MKDPHNSFRFYISQFLWLDWVSGGITLTAGALISFIIFGIMFINPAAWNEFILILSAGFIIGAVLCLFLSLFVGTNARPVWVCYSLPYWVLLVFWVSGGNGIIFATSGLIYCATISTTCWLCANWGHSLRKQKRNRN